MTVVLRAEDGRLLPLDPARWHGDATPVEEDLLENMTGPVLDVGCGPGRLVVELGRRGVPALGVDPAAGAVELARRRGASALQRSVFDRLPGEGRWETVILLDGNLGIGGDAVRLLQRCGELAAPQGTIIAEVEAPGVGWSTLRARLERGPERGRWFPWAVVGADAVGDVADGAGLAVHRIDRRAGGHRCAGRWFAHLGVPDRGRAARAARRVAWLDGEWESADWDAVASA